MARKDQGEKEQANQKEEPNPREETPQKAAQHDATHTQKTKSTRGTDRKGHEGTSKLPFANST
jgi:hypothetical protein